MFRSTGLRGKTHKSRVIDPGRCLWICFILWSRRKRLPRPARHYRVVVRQFRPLHLPRAHRAAAFLLSRPAADDRLPDMTLGAAPVDLFPAAAGHRFRRESAVERLVPLRRDLWLPGRKVVATGPYALARAVGTACPRCSRVNGSLPLMRFFTAPPLPCLIYPPSFGFKAENRLPAMLYYVRCFTRIYFTYRTSIPLYFLLYHLSSFL